MTGGTYCSPSLYHCDACLPKAQKFLFIAYKQEKRVKEYGAHTIAIVIQRGRLDAND